MKNVKVIIALVVVSLITGCSGIGLSSKMEMYAIDDRQETQTTRSKSMPLKCRFVSCDNEVRGS